MPVQPDPSRAREIGRRITQARQEAGGMTQRELGDLIGVTDRSIIAYEKGEVIPYRFLRKIEEATGANAAWLLHGEDAPTHDSSRDEEILAELRALRRDVANLRKALKGPS